MRDQVPEAKSPPREPADPRKYLVFFLLPKLIYPAFANVIDLSGPPVTKAVVERSLRLTEERIDRYIASGPNTKVRTHVRIPTFQEFIHCACNCRFSASSASRILSSSFDARAY